MLKQLLLSLLLFASGAQAQSLLTGAGHGQDTGHIISYFGNNGSGAGSVVSTVNGKAILRARGGGASTADDRSDGGGAGGMSEKVVSVVVGTSIAYVRGGTAAQSTITCVDPVVSMVANGGSVTAGGTASGGDTNTSGGDGNSHSGDNGGDSGAGVAGTLGAHRPAGGVSAHGNNANGIFPSGGAGGADKNDSGGTGAEGDVLIEFTY